MNDPEEELQPHPRRRDDRDGSRRRRRPGAGLGLRGCPAAAYRVTLKVSTDQAVQREDKVSLTGKVSPKAPGSKVTVQIRYDGAKRLESHRHRQGQGDGSYTFVDKPSTRASTGYRVVKPADEGGSKGVSKERAVEVYGWDWLAQPHPERHAQRDSDDLPMPINGDDYRPHPLPSTTSLSRPSPSTPLVASASPWTPPSGCRPDGHRRSGIPQGDH